GQAVRLSDGSYIDGGPGQNLAMTGSFTLSAWIKTSGAGDIISRYQNFGYYLSSRGSDGLEVAQCNYGKGYRIAGPNLGDKRWHYVVGVYDAEKPDLAVYVDGVPYAGRGDPASKNSFAAASNLMIGKSQTGIGQF